MQFHRTVREVLAEKVAFEQIFRSRGREPCGRRNTSDRGDRVFEGPEVGVYLAGLSPTEEGGVAGAGGRR